MPVVNLFSAAVAPIMSLFMPVDQSGSAQAMMELRLMVLENWDIGLIYMIAVLLILFVHEMGHFIATIIYKVPASLPFFLPFPINPIGTLGAVIGMQGFIADRKQIFDIGIAKVVWLNQLNPLFVAGWVGMLITGLNMMPVGQLDGGHVTYTLFGKAAHVIAKLTLVFAIAFMVYHQSFVLVIMVVLLLLVGTDHPPTRNDRVKLGPVRWTLGLASLVIPILCFPPLVFKLG